MYSQSCKATACSKSVFSLVDPSSSSRRGGKGELGFFLLLILLVVLRTVLENLRVKLAPVTPTELFLKFCAPFLLNQEPAGEVKQIAQMNYYVNVIFLA